MPPNDIVAFIVYAKTRLSSNFETFAAAAFIFDVRVVELKPLVQAFFSIVQFGSIKVCQTFAVNDHFNATILKDLVIILQLVDKLEHIGQTGTAGSSHPQSNADTLSTTLKEVLHAGGSGLCQCNRHRYSTND